MRVVDELAFGEEAFVRKVMVLDTCERQRELVAAELRDELGIRQQGDRLALPRAPRAGGAQLLIAVGMGETRAVRGDEVVTLGLWNRRQKPLPRLGKQLGRAPPVVPGQLGAPQREDPTHDERAHATGMRLCIRQRQRTAPRAAEYEPALDAKPLAQTLGVGNQMPGRVGLERSVRS